MPFLRPPVFALRNQIALMLMATLLVIPTVKCLAQTTEDVIVIRRQDGKGTINRKGIIQDWVGDQVLLESGGRVRTIEGDEIVEVQTRWMAEHVAGQTALTRGDVETATSQLQMALDQEPRPWARRVILADLVRTHRAAANYRAAIEAFLAIVSDDPETRFFHLCPLAWLDGDAILQPYAAELMQSNQSVSRLIGASWSLTGADKNKAVEVLSSLAENPQDQRLASLAIAQLWRTRMLTTNQRQVDAWSRQIDSFPPNLRGGPWLIVADCQARQGRFELAAINLMRLPILHTDQPDLAAMALYRTGHLLQNAGDSPGASSAWNELKSKFPTSIWAQQVPRSVPAGNRP